jgi:hypothetical protein
LKGRRVDGLHRFHHWVFLGCGTALAGPAAYAEARFNFRFWFQLSIKSGVSQFRLRLRKPLLALAEKFKRVVTPFDRDAARGRSKDFLNKG